MCMTSDRLAEIAKEDKRAQRRENKNFKRKQGRRDEVVGIVEAIFGKFDAGLTNELVGTIGSANEKELRALTRGLRQVGAL